MVSRVRRLGPAGDAPPAQAAQAVRDFSKNLDTLFGVHRFKEVHHHSAISYSKQHPK